MAIILPMPGNEDLASSLARLTGYRSGELDVRRFPDGESYVRLLSHVEGEDVILVCTLARPDPQCVAIAFASHVIRSAGATQIRLVAPYLPYMRQDRIFHSGEALSSRIFAKLVQQFADEIITIDPHLHRIRSLAEIYDIPTRVIHCAPLIAEWIKTNIAKPFIVGPDVESAQWAKEIAAKAGAPSAIFAKERTGDRKVHLTAPSLDEFRALTPVLVDDIVSSGATMLEAIRKLQTSHFDRPYCLAVHALCSAEVALDIKENSADFLTLNTIPNPYSRIDAAPLIADALAR